MQRTIQLLLLFLAAASTQYLAADTLRLSEPVAADERSETFGRVLDETLPSYRLVDLLERAEDQLGRNVLVTTKVGKVCQKKGCFFVAYEGDVTLRVSFLDYGFFVPTDIGGKQVTMSGELVKRRLTAAQAEHYATDMGGDSRGVRAGETFEFVAEAVQVLR